MLKTWIKLPKNNALSQTKNAKQSSEQNYQYATY